MQSKQPQATRQPNPKDEPKIEGNINPSSKQKDIDWKGFLDWSSKYNDGTLKSTVSPEDVRWFEQAMKAMINSEVDDMRNAIMVVDQFRNIIHEPELKERIVHALEIIFDIVERGIEQARDMVRIGMHQPLIQAYFECKDRGIKKQISIIFNSILQNNNFIKDYFKKEKVHERVFQSLTISTNPLEVEFDINLLNGLVIGYDKEIYDFCIENSNILVKVLTYIETEKSYRRYLNILRNLMECNPTKHLNLQYLAASNHVVKIQQKKLGEGHFEEFQQFINDYNKKK